MMRWVPYLIPYNSGIYRWIKLTSLGSTIRLSKKKHPLVVYSFAWATQLARDRSDLENRSSIFWKERRTGGNERKENKLGKMWSLVDCCVAWKEPLCFQNNRNSTFVSLPTISSFPYSVHLYLGKRRNKIGLNGQGSAPTLFNSRLSQVFIHYRFIDIHSQWWSTYHAKWVAEDQKRSGRRWRGVQTIRWRHR